ncbi:MAG: hypothetical protein H8E31_05315 [Planctomycetes bacterium]|nr:hypothetical protein [Planctomycetota bacterium]
MPRPEPGSASAQVWAGELAERLGKLREMLVLQFRAEETAGTMQELELDNPHASDAIRRMMGDHRRLMDRLRSILGSATVYAQGKSPQMLHLRRNTQVMLAALSEHEATESRLIQRLHSRDLGTASSGA